MWISINFADSLHDVTQRKNYVVSYFRPMKISSKIQTKSF